MAGGAEALVVFWKSWGILAVVLLSFTLQVTLFVLADIRRRKDSGMLKAILWSAYLLADATAIYALGHMSVATRSGSGAGEHRLMPMWAPSLLLHLGGQDNVSAYAVEDNRLWLRHLQSFGVQVLAAAFVLYESSSIVASSRTTSWLRWAAILVFVAGVLKYGERVWALKCSNGCTSSVLSATSYKDFRGPPIHLPEFAPASSHSHGATTTTTTTHRENLLLRAYTLLHIPKQLFSGPTRDVEVHLDYGDYEGEDMSRVIEMQLSMMHDLLFTKAAVVHTWYGLCIRAVSTPATVAAFLLFHLHASEEEDAAYHSRAADVTATYVLLAGAVVLEMASVLRAMFSTWTHVFLLERGWVRLGRALQFLPDLICWADMGYAGKRWGSMGQHNLSLLWPGGRISASSRIARWVGRQDWWESLAYPWSIRASPATVKLVVHLAEGGMRSRSRNDADELDITESRGREALRRGGMYEELRWSVDLDLDGSILVWHIATNAFLGWYRRERPQHQHALLELYPVEELSNYMLFLLAARPHLLPYPVTRQRYVQLCHDMFAYIKNRPTEDLPWIKATNGGSRLPDISPEDADDGSAAFITGAQLGLKLIRKAEARDVSDHDLLSMISLVWAEMLCYTAYRCNENSHSKHLSNGGDIITAVALQLLYSGSYMTRDMRRKRR